MRYSFLPLYLTNFFGVVNDNFLKTLAGFVAISYLADENAAATLMGVTGAALVLPYILCSPLADRLTCIFEKKKIFRLAKWIELPIIATAIVGFALHSIPVIIASILLMGLQSSLYSPAKYALVRDIGGEERISTGMGGMEGVAFLAVLAGTIAASLVADNIAPWIHWCMLGAFALLGLAFSYTIKANEEKSRQIHSVNPFRYMARARRMARSTENLGAVIFTLSVFWFVAAMLQQGLIVYGRETMKLDSAHTGAMLCVATLGIVAGQIVAGFIDRKRFLLGANLLTGLVAAALLFFIFFATPGYPTLLFALAILAFDLGLFKLPLDAEIQKLVKGPRLNTILAYFNQVSFLFMFASSAAYILISLAFGPRAFFFALALVMVLAPLAFLFSSRKTLLFTGKWIFSMRYRITLEGLESLADKSKSYLVLPNHPAIVDPMLVVTSLWKSELKPLVDELFFHTGFLAPHILKTLGALEVPDLRKRRSRGGAAIAKGLADTIIESLSRGRNIIFYPSGHIQTEKDVDDIGTRQLAYNVCRALPENTEVVLVRTRGLWGSIWSRANKTSSPSFLPTLLKSLGLWLVALATRRKRSVSIHLERATDDVKSWASLARLDFNRCLEDWYNAQ